MILGEVNWPIGGKWTAQRPGAPYRVARLGQIGSEIRGKSSHGAHTHTHTPGRPTTTVLCCFFTSLLVKGIVYEEHTVNGGLEIMCCDSYEL